jgi:hypothetical protein
MMFFMRYSKANRVLVIYPTAGQDLPQELRMYEKKDKISGVIWWKSFDGKVKFPEPPAECIRNIKGKGLKWACVTRLSEDEYKYNTLTTSKDTINFVPFTAVEREIIIQEFAKAAKKRASNWLRDALVPSVAILSFVVIVIMLLVFWGDIAQPALESHQLALSVSQQNQDIMKALIQNGLIELPADQITSSGVNVTTVLT